MNAGNYSDFEFHKSVLRLAKLLIIHLYRSDGVNYSRWGKGGGVVVNDTGDRILNLMTSGHFIGSPVICGQLKRRR